MSVPTDRGRPGDGDRQSAFAATLVDEWVRGGVSHAVLCAGSRSTPLALALAADPRLSLCVRLDERSAGFVALGIGLATGRPAVIVTTSGTAAAELHPAVVEADLARVPLLVCTADRPPEARGVGAPQTIDQTHLFGRAARWFADPGVPAEAARATWRSLAARSVAESVAGPRGPGPVHLNLPFREPLLGDPQRGGGPAPGRPDGAPWHQMEMAATPPPDALIGRLAGSGLLDPGSRGVIVAGSGCGDPAAVLGLADALDWPVLADPRSGLRTTEAAVVAAADGILRSERFAHAHRPSFVVRLGGRWASKVVNAFLDGSPALVADPFDQWPDPERSAERLVRCDPTLLCEALLGATDRGGTRSAADRSGAWRSAWDGAEARARGVLADSLGGRVPLTEPALAHQVFASLPAGASLFVSSSMPVRDLESFGLPRRDPPTVFANRGANGIDGVTSTALGVTLGVPGPTVALVGDLAFLHDVSALIGPTQARPPLTLVVADNHGGGIFSFLPQAAALDAGAFERLFGTPQAPDVADVARGCGWAVEDLDPSTTGDDLRTVLDRAIGGGGGVLVRVQLPDRSTNVAAHDQLNADVVVAVEQG